MAKALSLFEARAVVLAAVATRQLPEQVPLRSAHGRVLAERVVAPGPWPATDRAAMDGFAMAVGADGLAVGMRLPVVGQSLAGRPFAESLAVGTAIRIMTGAVVPVGANAVVPVEQTSGFAGATVQLLAPVRAGQHVRLLGSELAAGTELMSPGRWLRAAEIGVLAVLGQHVVTVAQRPRVAIVATGDEVVAIEASPLPHQVRESNSWALAAQVEECGGIALRLGVAPDEPVALRALLQRGLEQCDVLVTIGGISKGTHDLVHGTLAELGVATHFHGIDLKPGKPTYFGMAAPPAGPRYVFGLPGNPASSFTVFDLLVRPLLLAMQGAAPTEWATRVPVGGAAWHANARLQAVPARLVPSAVGLVAELVSPSPSGDPFSLLNGSVYALVEEHRAPPGPQERAVLTLVARSSGVQLP